MDNDYVKIAIGADNATADRPPIGSDQRSIGAYHDDRRRLKLKKKIVGTDQRRSAPTRRLHTLSFCPKLSVPLQSGVRVWWWSDALVLKT